MSDITNASLAIPPEARSIQNKEMRTYRALSAKLRHGISALGWVGTVTFACTTVLFAAGWSFFPAKVTDVVYIERDPRTGQMQRALPAKDAPVTWTEREAHSAMTHYIRAREQYTPEIDDQNWQRVRAMSAAVAWPEYESWLNSRESPKSRLGRNGGHSRVDAIAYSEPLVSADGTRTYQVRWDYREYRAESQTEPQRQTCVAQISFKFVPDIIATPSDADYNPYGMQVIAYNKPAVCK